MRWIKKVYHKFKNRFRKNSPFIIVCVLLSLFVFFYLYDHIVYNVYPGEGGVLYKRFSGGTVVDRVYPEGIHFIFPWDKMYIYNLRIQQIYHEFQVLSKNGLKVTLRLSIRYFPERTLVGVLHKFVGPDYVNTVVIPEIEHVLRILIGHMEAEEVYTTQRAIIEKALNNAVEKVHRRFIAVDTVIIKQISLPPVVEQAIQNKIDQKHRALAMEFVVQRQVREKQRKIIEGQAMEEYNKTVQRSLTPEILKWMSIQATLELAKSNNSKVVVVGGGKEGLPVFGNIILDAPGAVQFQAEPSQSAEEAGTTATPEGAQTPEASPSEPQGDMKKDDFGVMKESNTSTQETPPMPQTQIQR